jgi:DNA transposition AAA+ family ATPase
MNEIKEIDAWLRATGMTESRLGLLACANAKAVARIRSGDARIKTLDAVMAYIRGNPASRRVVKRKPPKA